MYHIIFPIWSCLSFSFHLEFDGTNNMVKYEAPLHAFELAKDYDINLLKTIETLALF